MKSSYSIFLAIYIDTSYRNNFYHNYIVYIERDFNCYYKYIKAFVGKYASLHWWISSLPIPFASLTSLQVWYLQSHVLKEMSIIKRKHYTSWKKWGQQMTMGEKNSLNILDVLYKREVCECMYCFTMTFPGRSRIYTNSHGCLFIEWLLFAVMFNLNGDL